MVSYRHPILSAGSLGTQTNQLVGQRDGHILPMHQMYVKTLSYHMLISTLRLSFQNFSLTLGGAGHERLRLGLGIRISFRIFLYTR